MDFMMKCDTKFNFSFSQHGHNFYIMGSGSGKTPQPDTYDKDPSVRDTITVPGDS